MSVWPPEFAQKGTYVAIEGLTQAHCTDLEAASADGDLSRLWYTTVPAPNDVSAEIDRRLGLRVSGSMQPFAILHPVTGQAVGMTTFMNIDAVNKRIEIGSTWYRKSVQRSLMNTECKRILLTHAFETLDCIAVEFRTHFMNHQSRRAIERLGAKLDGVLRAHSVLENGTVRDTAVYSITAPEWPSVKANLDWKLAQPRESNQ